MTDALCETRAPHDVPDAARIAAQNDAFRRAACLALPRGKGNPAPDGQIVVTAAVHAEGLGFVMACLELIGRLEHFPPENDPCGRHDFGSVEAFGTAVWFKIDGVDAPSHRGIAMCQSGFVRSQIKERKHPWRTLASSPSTLQSTRSKSARR